MALCAAPALAEDVTPVAVELSFDFVQLLPGSAGTVMVTGWDVASVEGRFDGRPLDFHREGESLVAFIAASLDIARDDQYLEATVRLYSGEEVHYRLPVEIAWVDWGQQNIVLPSNLGYLLEPALNDAETALLKDIYAKNTPQRFWDGPFALPLFGATTSPFGVYRTYNSSFSARHTGQDIRANTGTPVYASATGQVALAERLEIRGNTVILDHGWGVFTAYCHLSDISVRPGQMVEVGQVVGLSGNTGRSTGPHLHWEMAVSGTWIDPMTWVEPALP